MNVGLGLGLGLGLLTFIFLVLISCRTMCSAIAAVKSSGTAGTAVAKPVCALSSRNLKQASAQDKSKSTRKWIATIQRQDTAQYAWTSVGQCTNHSFQATWHDVLALGAADTAKGRDFRNGLVEVLKQCPHKAIYFECNPVRADQVKNTPFLMTLLKSSSLAKVVHADPEPFSKQLIKARQSANGQNDSFAAAFENLSGDAVLIVPTGAASSLLSFQSKDLDAYAHLMTFVRRGSVDEVDAFWKAVFRQMTQQLRQKPQQWIWLNTSGDGVSWLHMRCDTSPKYYRFRPFKTV